MKKLCIITVCICLVLLSACSAQPSVTETGAPEPTSSANPRDEALEKYGFVKDYMYNEMVQDFILEKDVAKILIGHYEENQCSDWDFANRLVFTISERDELEVFLPEYYRLIEDYKEITEEDMVAEAKESLEKNERYLIYGQSNAFGAVIAIELLPSEQEGDYSIELAVNYDGVYEEYWNFIQSQWISEIMPYDQLDNKSLQEYMHDFMSHSRELIVTYGDEPKTDVNAILYNLSDLEYQSFKDLLLSDQAMGFYGGDINLAQEEGHTNLNYDVGKIRCTVDMRDNEKQIKLSQLSMGITDFSQITVEKTSETSVQSGIIPDGDISDMVALAGREVEADGPDDSMGSIDITTAIALFDADNIYVGCAYEGIADPDYRIEVAVSHGKKGSSIFMPMQSGQTQSIWQGGDQTHDFNAGVIFADESAIEIIIPRDDLDGDIGDILTIKIQDAEGNPVDQQVIHCFAVK